MMGRNIWMTMCLVGLVLASTCGAATITFDETEIARLYLGGVDTNRWYTTPTGTNGGEDATLLGGYSWKTTAVMRFTDLSSKLSLGPGESVVVNSASLKLYICDYAGSTSNAVDVFQMNRGDWVYNESTWKSVNALHWWSTDSDEWGAHYPSSSATPVASLPLAGNYQVLASVSVPTAMIESWINDGENYGVRLASKRETIAPTDRMYIAASNAGEYGTYGVTSAYRPQLEIDYTIVPEPATMSLIGFGAFLTLLRKKNRK